VGQMDDISGQSSTRGSLKRETAKIRDQSSIPVTKFIDPVRETKASLKVHKNENLFGFDFEFCTISMLVMHK
jgi:hypothetical protein